jgi:hypothetical protein
MISKSPVWLALGLTTIGNGTSLGGVDLPDFRLMSRWTRYRLPIVVGLVLVGGVGVGTVWSLHLPPTERGDAFALLGIGLSLVSALPLLVQLKRGHRSTDSRPVDVLATLLTQAVYGQWRKAADERRLVTPAPIPLRWSLSDLDMMGPVAAAVGVPDTSPAFPPLLGHATITEEELRAGGGRRELHQLFAGLDSGRIVVVGAPGAGKSGAAILLVLDTLTHRDSLDDTERARVPVPVLFTVHGWDPNTTSVQDWLRDRLVATYPLLQRRGGDADAAALVAARDKVALILDGLDEMDEALRPAALQALSDAPFRVVVLTRSQEMIEATSKAWLVGAVAVHLRDVTGTEAADYLERARTGPPPAGWPGLLAHLREHPEGVLARGLSTPLTLTLLRDTYQAGDDVGELLDTSRYSTAENIERHLIARVLPAAYASRPGRPQPRYSEAQVCQALTFLAQRMNQDHTRDLSWWHIPRWASTMPRIFTSGLAYGLASGFVLGLVVGLTVGLVEGLTIGLITGLMSGPILGIVGWLTGKRAAGRFTGKLTMIEPRRIRTTNWRAVVSRQALGVGLSSGLMSGVWVELLGGLPGEFPNGLPDGLGFGLTIGFVSGLASGLTEGGTVEDRPLGPREIWRNDRAASLMMGFVGCLTFGLVFGLVGGLIALVYGLVSGLMAGLVSPGTFTTLAWRQLRLAGHVPAVRLMPFLEDAQDRGVLRTVGGVYQFRHATLQDQLADQTTPTPRCRGRREKTGLRR